MKLEELVKGTPVVYIPGHLFTKEIEDEQLGIVSSSNDHFAFVRYKGNENNPQATDPNDLYRLTNRPDLINRLGLEVKPINRVCELWLEEQALLDKLKHNK